MKRSHIVLQRVCQPDHSVLCTCRMENTSQTKRSIKKPAARKPSSNREYNLGYFTLWWSRMTREGVRDEVARKKKEENDTNSARLRLLLGCGKTGDETFEQDNLMLIKPLPLPSGLYTGEKNTI